MGINIKKYKTNSIYVLNNGYYIDLIVQDNGTTVMVVKSPEGAAYLEKPLEDSIVSNSQNLQAALNSELTTLSPELNEEELSILEILPKKEIPPRKSTTSFKIKGVVVDKKGNKLDQVKIQPFIITPPPPPPTLPNVGSEFDSIEEFEANQTNFDTTTFSLGGVIVTDPLFTNEDGIFTWEYIGDENVDFSKTYIVVTKEEYFPKDVGPNLVKSGEEFSPTPQPTISKFEGPTQTIDQKLIRQEDGKYRAEIDLKALELGETVKGIGINQDREIAKKKARSDAERKLALKAPPSSNGGTPPSEEEKIKFDIYDVGKIILIPTKIDIQEKIVEAQVEIQKAENQIVEKQAILDTPFELRLSSLFNILKERLKRLLIPYVLNLLAKFGPNILANILGGKKDPLADRICLPEDQLLRILKKRNRLTRQLNNLYKTVNTISKLLKITSAVIFGLKLGIKIATVTSTPFTFTAQVNEGIAFLKRTLTRADPTVSSLTVTAATIGFLLGYVLELLSKLDNLIQDCAEQVDPGTGEFVLSFDKIDIEVNSFKDPGSPEEQDIIDPLTGKPFPYKGFTFEIKNDISQNFQYPKRYAIARNVQGIQVLRSESSFASNPSVLIEELKFVIDKDNLRAD